MLINLFQAPCLLFTFALPHYLRAWNRLDVYCLDLHAQGLGFVLKSEQREVLDLLLRGKDVFCVL